MSRWVDVTSSHQIPPGEVKAFQVEDHRVCIAHLEGGHYFAVQDRCPHHGVSLGDLGSLEEGEIVCGWHRWRFDPRTGACPISAAATLRCYPLKEEAGHLWIDLGATHTGQSPRS